MTNDEPPGYRYWSLVEPVWIPLNESWDDGPSGFLARFLEVPATTGHLYAGHWCQSEVCNGGLHQFFYNSTGILAPEAAAGFRAIGLPEWPEILEDAMRYFGAAYPRERELRQKLLPQFSGPDDRNPFHALDERFFDWLGDDHDRWNRAADAYAAMEVP